MSFDFSRRPQREASAAVGFAGNRLERASEKRSERSLADAVRDPATRVLVLGEGRALLSFEASAPRIGFSVGEAVALGARLEDAVLLGFDADAPMLAAPATPAAALPEAIKAIDLRSLNSQALLDPAELAALGQAASLFAWNANCRFCGRCGAPTEMRIGGYKRACTGCGADHFPRTDPVVIMLAVTGDRCLLGRGPHFAPGVYSTLAGFVEPGETIEEAVRREIAEESAIAIGRVAYHASQPWPFPHSLMIGCICEALSEEVRIDDAELEDCRWFDRDEVRAMLAARHAEGLSVPPRAAIAHHLIEAWAGE